MSTITRSLCTSAAPIVLTVPALAATPAAVTAINADIACANYGDGLQAAKALDAFLIEPSAEARTAAEEAWLATRVPYQQTEVFRFGNPIVDAREGRVNAWPLDAGNLLAADVEEMDVNREADGEARAQLTADGAKRGVAMILTGLGSLSHGELAGERMKLGLMLRDPEEEHDCFADNTHNSHVYNVVGMANVHVGRYGDAEGNALLQAAIDALVAQTIERIVVALDLGQLAFEGSDSLDNPQAVFQ